MIDGNVSEDGRWLWFGGGWRQLSEDGRYWWDGQGWRSRLDRPTTRRSPGAWALVVIGAGLIAIGLLRGLADVLVGIVNGTLAYEMGRATVAALIFVLPGGLVLKRGWTGRWF
jgi:hypothetical protein